MNIFKKALKVLRKGADSGLMDFIPGGKVLSGISSILGKGKITDARGNVIEGGKFTLTPEQGKELQVKSMQISLQELEENHEHIEKKMRLEIDHFEAETQRTVAFEGSFKDIPEEAKLKRSMIRPDIVRDVWNLGKWMFGVEGIIQVGVLSFSMYKAASIGGSSEITQEAVNASLQALESFKYRLYLPWDFYSWVFSGTVMVFFGSRTLDKGVATYKKGDSAGV